MFCLNLYTQNHNVKGRQISIAYLDGYVYNWGFPVE